MSPRISTTLEEKDRTETPSVNSGSVYILTVYVCFSKKGRLSFGFGICLKRVEALVGMIQCSRQVGRYWEGEGRESSLYAI